MGNDATAAGSRRATKFSIDPALVSRILVDLVRTPSTNPGAYEADIAKRVCTWLSAASLSPIEVETFPDRPSIAAVLHGAAPGPRLVLNGHLDTVPVDGSGDWSVDPFGADVRDDALFGRGACDMKAGLALQIAIAHALASSASKLKGTLVLHFAVGEERAEPGTMSLLEAGFDGDLGIVTEPTALSIATAQRGAVHYRITIHGESGHAAQRGSSRNPIDMLPTVLEVVARHDRLVSARSHPLLPSPSLTPTVVSAGDAPNSVPGSVDLVCDRRLLPGESHEDDLDALRAALRDRGLNVDIAVSGHVFAPSESPAQSRVAEALACAFRTELAVEPAVVGTAFASDVRNLINDAGMDAVTFGPGQLEQCHARDEHISLREVMTGGRVLLRAVEDLLG